jgi:hypothetical protein
MGFNTTVVILNDALLDIEDDPDFGKKMARAINQVSWGAPVSVSAGGHVGAARVIETHHADCHTLIAVGWNDGKQIGHVWTKDGDPKPEVVLREMARDLGYVVYKKKKK